MSQGRYHRNPFLLGEPHYRVDAFFVNRPDDQVGFSEFVGFHDFFDLLRIAARVEKRQVDRPTVPQLYAVQPQEEPLVEFDVIVVYRAVFFDQRQQQGDVQGLGRVQGAEFDFLDLPVGERIGCLGLRSVGAQRVGIGVLRYGGLGRNPKHGPGFQVGRLQAVVELRQFGFADPEAPG